MIKKQIPFLALLGMLGMTSVSQASMMTYTSASSFDSAMTGLVTTSYAANGSEPSGYSGVGSTGGATGYYYDSVPVTFNGGQFAGSTTFEISNNTFFWGNTTASPFTGNFLYNRRGGTALTINFNNPVYGFALDFALQQNWNGSVGYPGLTVTYAGSPVDVSVPGYTTTYVYPGWVATGVPASYEGFASSTPFTSVSIYDPSMGFSTSDITVASGINGSTLTGGTLVASTTAPIPSPGTLVLLAPIVLGSLRRASSQRILHS